MTQSALETFSVTRHAVDPRADGARRLVHISRTSVIIERTLDGVRMRVAVPVAAYRDLVLAVRLASAQAALRLCHEDPDLDVVLAAGEGIEVARRAKAWGEALGKAVRIEEACVKIGVAISRRKKRAQPTRRSSFSRRRKIGRGERLATVFAGEREIVARN